MMIKINLAIRPFLFLFVICFFVYFECYAQHGRTLLFIGSYTDGQEDDGIYIYDFNTLSGELTPLGSGKNLINPSFLAPSLNGKYLYACTKTKMPIHGTLSAFEIDSINGQIKFLNEESVGTRNPVHVDVHPAGKYIAVASYTDPGVSLFKTNEDGSLQSRKQLIEFVDKSVLESRQASAHLHSANFSPDGQYLYVPDLGGDKIRAFTLKKEGEPGMLVNDILTIKTKAGSGPRHMDFHPNGKFAYCVEELSGTLAAYHFRDGNLQLIDRYFSYSKNYPDYGAADVHVSPDGKFVYSSNRLHGENTIAIFEIDSRKGSLKLVGHSSTYGERPRNFTIDPTGQFILVANVSSNNVVVLKRDITTGLLIETGIEISVSNPSCLMMRTYKR